MLKFNDQLAIIATLQNIYTRDIIAEQLSQLGYFIRLVISVQNDPRRNSRDRFPFFLNYVVLVLVCF